MIRLHLLGALEFTASDGRDLRPLLAQPKRLAVLAYLAARPAGEFVRRDTVVGVFWPEQDQGNARRALRQTLHVLRTHLGPDAIASRGDEDVALDPAAVHCDVASFVAALEDRRFADALETYRGDLLAGFFLSGAGIAFEHWLEETRAALRQRARAAATTLADSVERAGDVAAAGTWARRALSLAPDDEVALRRLLGLLERAGDRAGAVRAYDAFARRLAQDLGTTPSRETRQLVERIRDSGAAVTPTPQAPPLARPALAPLGRPRPPRRRWLVPGVAGVVLVTLVAAAGTMLGRRADPPVLAVGDVRSGDSALSPLAIGALPELLATDLARVGGLRVISHPRLEEVAAQLEPARRSAITIARAAGASVLLEGELYRRRDSLRLDLRQVDAKTGVVQNALTLRGRDVFALADSATQWFAGRYHLDAPGGAIAAATSASLVAHGLYNEGLRAYYRDADVRAAERLFRAALDQDSTFAMAAYYLARTLDAQELPSSGAAFERAARLAANSPAREALFIRVWWAAAQNDPAWPVLAESLAARYPDEPDAQYAVGRGRSMSNNYFGAVAPLRAAIRQDSLSLSAATATRCVACDAYYALIATYVSLDSVPAAEAVARDWVRRQPRSAIARDVLRDMLDRQERYAEADDLTRTVAQLSGAARPSYLTRVSRAVRAGDWATADQLVAVDGTDTTTDERQWWRIITLRYEGRPRAAAAEASARLRAVRDRTVRPLGFLPVGAALFEAGDLPGAAAAFDSAAWASPEQRREYPGVAARHIAWACNLHATVAAAQGDTALLRILADSVAFYGPRSALGRDRMLPGYIHGLLLELQGNPRAAIDSFHAAAFSPTEGFTRVNLELARSLVRLGRPRDAIGWLEAALRGGIEGSNFYVTRPALRDELGRIFAAMGQVDSARTQFALVARAWAQAEPPYSARRDSALAYLARTARRRD